MRDMEFARLQPILSEGIRPVITGAVIPSGWMGEVFVIGSLLIAGVEIPSPITPLRMVFEPIGKMICKSDRKVTRASLV
ncbi:hypothetical protein [Effusibacillus consociatus]|uniref:hypothetical protein n=1 Tax=Effusibacillus consociatus TaxID=1117041 RepID=UPI0036D3E64A